MLDTAVEKSKCFVWNKTNYLTKGRLEMCTCVDSCRARWAILQYIGLAVEVSVTVNEAGYKMSTQQLVGSRLFKKFTEQYCEVDMVNNHMCYKFKKENLPFQVPFENHATAVFERNNIPVTIANRS